MSIERIAELANVSKATVSNALTGNRPVAQKTRQRVLAIAQELGYHPQASARALSTGRSHAIGFVSSGGYDRQSEFLAGLLGGAVDFLESQSYRTTVFHVEPLTEDVPSGVLQRSVDGLIAVLRWSERFLNEVSKRDIPMVLALPVIEPSVGYDCVQVDDVGGGSLATKHLLSIGHRRIAYVPTLLGDAEYVSRLRWSGYVEEMSRAGIAVYPGGDRVAPIDERIATLFSLPEPPTALVCMSSQVAIMVMGALKRRRLEVPRDVSLVGFDDTAYSELMTPSITVVDVPFVSIGSKAAEILLERLSRPDQPARRVMLEANLIVRETSATHQ